MPIWWTKTLCAAIFSAYIHLFMSNLLLGFIFGDVPFRPWPQGPPNDWIWILLTPTSNYVNLIDKNIARSHFFSWYPLIHVKSAVRIHFWGRPISSLTSRTSTWWDMDTTNPYIKICQSDGQKHCAQPIFQLIFTHTCQPIFQPKFTYTCQISS